MFSGANAVAMIMLALSGSARSNGALNAGYFCFQALLQAYDAAIQKKRPIVSFILVGSIFPLFLRLAYDQNCPQNLQIQVFNFFFTKI
jgi:phosphatidylinositol glycan class V